MDFIKKNWQSIIFLGLWCGITLFQLFNHTPWYDEAHAWNIAQSLNFLEILDFMHIEGHTFLWYLCIMPFAKLNIAYPYSMLIVNWIFCFIAILILWFKAPFQSWLKVLIIFSFPFLQYYPIVARCYAIGIMFLFLVASFEQEKLKRPNLYALLLVMLANTSVVAMFAATILGAQFVFELIKNKVKKVVPYMILLIGSGLILYQLGVHVSWMKLATLRYYHAYQNSKVLPLLLSAIEGTYKTSFILITFLAIVLFLTVFYLKNKIFPVFLIFTTMCMLAMYCFIYRGFFWHDLFFYIFLIVSVWIVFNKYENLKWKVIPIALLAIISCVLILWKPSNEKYNAVYFDDSKYVAKFILNNKNLRSAKLVASGYKANTIGPYLRKAYIDVKILCSGFSFNSYPKNWYFCGITNPLYSYLDNFYREDSNTYFILYKSLIPDLSSIRVHSFPDNEKYYDLTIYADLGNTLIYQFKNEK